MNAITTTKIIFIVTFLILWSVILLAVTLFYNNIITLTSLETPTKLPPIVVPTFIPTASSPTVFSPTAVIPTATLYPTATPYMLPTITYGCWIGDVAGTHSAMNVRREPHTSSVVLDPPYHYVPAYELVPVLKSVLRDDYCWLYLGLDYGHGWMAATEGVYDPGVEF